MLAGVVSFCAVERASSMWWLMAANVLWYDSNPLLLDPIPLPVEKPKLSPTNTRALTRMKQTLRKHCAG